MDELTPQDKDFLFQTVLQVGLAVMTASPSGVEGTFLETETMVQAPTELAKNFPNSALIQAILAANKGGEEDVVDEAGKPASNRAEAPDEILVETLTMCRRTAEILAGVDPAEAEQYKSWVLACGAAVAEVSKEGGFLGFRKKLVTDDERDTLEQVARVLGASMPQLP